MKRLSHIVLCLLLTVVVFNCKDDNNEDKSVPVISNLERVPEAPKPGESVVVTANVTSPEGLPLTAVVIEYTVDQVSQTDIVMSIVSGNTYSGTIPAQGKDDLQVVVNYTVSASNKNGKSLANDASKGNYTVESANSFKSIYEMLVINEVCGINKFVEIYNKGSQPVPLTGVSLIRNENQNNPWWTGGADAVITPGGYYAIVQSGIATPGADEYTGATGISAQATLKFELTDPDKKLLDTFDRPLDGVGYGVDISPHYGRIMLDNVFTEYSFARCPDGTGNFGLATSSCKEPNPGTSAGQILANQAPAIRVDNYWVQSPEEPTVDDDVIIGADVRPVAPANVASVVLKWTINGAPQSDITMNITSGTRYEATIPKQDEDAVIAYIVHATNNLGEASQASGSYTVAEALSLGTVDYSKLRLNEISGPGNDCQKFYELINIGDVDIPLIGCRIYYNANSSTGGAIPTGKGNLTWTGVSSQVASAGNLFSLIGRNGTDCSPPHTPNSFTTGLTAARILVITLEDPEGNMIDRLIRAEDTGIYAITDKSFSRIPDGTGDFYFTDPSPNIPNGSDSSGLLKVPETKVGP